MKMPLEARCSRLGAAALCVMGIMAGPGLAASDATQRAFVTAPAAQAEAAQTVARIKVLLAQAEKHFGRFRRGRPISDVRTANACEGCSEGVMHAARYRHFHADFLRDLNGRITLFSMWTDSPGFPLPLGLKLGQTRQQVRTLMGQAQASDAAYLLYTTGEETGSSVNFSFAHDKMVAVSWHFPVPH